MAKKLKVASRVDRWLASGIDGFALVLALIASVLIAIKFEYYNYNTVVFLYCLIITPILALQAYFLSSAGQTIGKKIMKIRIVRLDTGRNGGFMINVLLRFIVGVFLPGAVFPFYPFIDAAFLFRNDEKRAVHDLVAGTTVVEA